MNQIDMSRVCVRELAIDLFRTGLAQVDSLVAPRSWALPILGLYHYLRQFGGDGERSALLTELSEKLLNEFFQERTEKWPWLEPVVTYDNGRLPQALIVAGYTLSKQPMIDLGLDVLQWLLDVQKSERGFLSVVEKDDVLPGDRALALLPFAIRGKARGVRDKATH